MVHHWPVACLNYLLEDRISSLYKSWESSHCLPTPVLQSSVAAPVASACHLTSTLPPLMEEWVEAGSALWHHKVGGWGGSAEATVPLAQPSSPWLDFLSGL